MQQKQITYNSANLFYRVTGKGKPVILLHGFGEDGEIWNRQIEFLNDHFQLIVPDLPGSGKSELIEDMSIEGMAESIKAIIDFELFRFPLQRAEGVCIIGHSMGGYITLALAQKYPELLSAFGLFSSSAFADSEEKKEARLKSIAFVKNNGAYEFLKTSIPGLFDENWSKYHQQEIVGLVERSKQFSADAIIKYYQAMIARPDRTEVFTTFSGPVLFIIGEHDKAVPFEQSMQQCYLPAQSHVHILRNSAHMGMWEETDKANAALLQFLQQAT
ncbi:alpha/beta fold hydrolase [Ferruginibacter sp.]|nr:alpha/beta hydrolase [Ferruginibacter sp.]